MFSGTTKVGIVSTGTSFVGSGVKAETFSLTSEAAAAVVPVLDDAGRGGFLRALLRVDLGLREVEVLFLVAAFFSTTGGKVAY